MSICRLVADVDLHRLHVSDTRRYPFFLETVATVVTKPAAEKHYDILFAFPQDTLVLEGNGQLHVKEQLDNLRLATQDFCEGFDQWWQSLRDSFVAGDHESSDLPFTGGWFVFLSYELAAQIEPKLVLDATSGDLPIAFATRIPAALIRSHSTGQVQAVCESNHETLLDQMIQDVNSCLQQSRPIAQSMPNLVRYAEDPQQDYLDDVKRTKEYIREGDVFQVNLSRQWALDYSQPIPTGLVYERLRLNNPSPFFGVAQYRNTTIISSSPERLVRVAGSAIETRPIAGTRPRGSKKNLDLALSRELLAHPKERAEHIMLIDLERNDIGRVCRAGSVVVNELMGLETYAHVHHIVSNVRGKLREDISPGQIIRAVFPGGTITGCPKVRCMEIISELEKSARGAYTGSMGYINLDGSMDLNILIRTLVCDGNAVTLRAGAGIVSDSKPELELEETRAKARGLLLALGACRT